MNEIVKYQAGGQEVSLSADVIKKYLVAGSGQVSDQEIVLFQELCKYRGLNPFLREAYLIKYGGNSPATIVVGKDAVLKRALSNPSYAGHEAGITVLNREGKLEQRAGSLLLPREELVGGWCNVIKHTASGNQVIRNEVSFTEYVVTKDGKPSAQWAVRPATMIRKVALVQALREAFPEDVAGMYEAEELGIDEKNLDVKPVDMTKVVGDITPVEPVQNVPTAVVEPSDAMLDLLDLSDADFLSSNFTWNGKTKMIGQIKLDTWKAISVYDKTTDSVRQVAIRAIQLLDNSFEQADMFVGTPFEGK